MKVYETQKYRMKWKLIRYNEMKLGEWNEPKSTTDKNKCMLHLFKDFFALYTGVGQLL
jgi:hypothetical protein